VLVLGSESHGLSEAVQSLKATVISIPKFGGADSLNVAMAGGIALALLGQAGWIGEGRESASG